MLIIDLIPMVDPIPMLEPIPIVDPLPMMTTQQAIAFDAGQ